MKEKFVDYVDVVSKNLLKRRVRSARSASMKLYLLKYFPILVLLLLIRNFLVALICSALWWLFVTIFFDHRVITQFSPQIYIWFGVPGSGKTSMAAFLTAHSIKSGYAVLSNVPINGALKLEVDDLGEYDMSFDGAGAHVILDEGSIDFDNRNFKGFALSSKPKYFALHRHMNNRVDVFSQAYDIDKRIRDRAGSRCMYQLKRLPLPGFVYYRNIKKVLFIKKDDKQLIDGFQYSGLPRVCYVRSVWKSFDTLDISLCPKAKKNWQAW